MTTDTRQSKNLHIEITTDRARAIASDWHDGQASALYAFASSGHFDADALLREIEAELARLLVSDDSTDDALDMVKSLLKRTPGFFSLHGHAGVAALSALYRYVRDRADRCPA